VETISGKVSISDKAFTSPDPSTRNFRSRRSSWETGLAQWQVTQGKLFGLKDSAFTLA